MTATQYVYDFTQGDKDQQDLLGGKGANLAEMTNLGLPVPPCGCWRTTSAGGSVTGTTHYWSVSDPGRSSPCPE